MSVIYRALWTTSPQSSEDDQLRVARQQFSVWAAGDDGQPAFADGESEVKGRRVRIQRIATPTGAGLECIATDIAARGSEDTTWRTVLRMVTQTDATHVWVDNLMETEDPTQRVKVGRPRIVDDLLDNPGKHTSGPTEIVRGPMHLTVEDILPLIHILRDGNRRLPVIAFTEPRFDDGGRWLRRAETAAKRTAAIATVVTIPGPAVEAFRADLGSLAVWDGAVRIYTPTPLVVLC